MFDSLMEAVKAALSEKWTKRLPFAFSQAREVAANSPLDEEVRKAIKSAYLAGYRQAYWAGVIDMVEAGADAETQAPRPNVVPFRLACTN